MNKQQALVELYDGTECNGHLVITASFTGGRTDFLCQNCPSEGRMIGNRLVFEGRCTEAHDSTQPTLQQQVEATIQQRIDSYIDDYEKLMEQHKAQHAFARRSSLDQAVTIMGVINTLKEDLQTIQNLFNKVNK